MTTLFKIIFVIVMCGAAITMLKVHAGKPIHVGTGVTKASVVSQFQLYGLNCSRCYRAIERKVASLPGVERVYVNDRTKVMTIVGKGYSMKAVHRIVRSEKQRIL